MRTIYLFICYSVLFFSITTVCAQNGELKTYNKIDSIIPFLVQDPAIKQIFDKVIPGVNFLYSVNYSTVPSSQFLICKYRDRPYEIESINRLLLDNKYLGDSTKLYSDEDLITAFMYLEIAQAQSSCKVSFPVNFRITKSNKEYTGKILDYYNQLGFNILNLNYHSEASWSFGPKESHKWSYDFNIIDGEIISVVRNKIINNKVEQSSEFRVLRYSKIFEKFEPSGREFRIKELLNEKKNDVTKGNCLGFLLDKVECINFSGPIEVFAHGLYLPKYYNFETSQTVYGSLALEHPMSKFKVNSYTTHLLNPKLKIFTCSEFGTSIELFSSTLTEHLGSGENFAVTDDNFAPDNSSNDGFCCFKLYDGNTLVQDITSNYIVLNKRRVDYISNTTSIYNLHYAERFFFNYPSGQSEFENYLTKFIQIFNEAWDKQVNDWNFSKGVYPCYLYNLSINPYQQSSTYLFRTNGLDGTQPIDMFQEFGPDRELAFTANPQLYINYTSTLYTEDEFMKIGINHEFYHGMQKTINPTLTYSASKSWLIEGQARAIQSLIGDQLKGIEFNGDDYGLYAQDANRYIDNKLNSSLLEISYPYCLFWRFLYENYSTSTNIQDKLAIFRESCIDFSAVTLPGIENHMNSKFNSTACPGIYANMDEAICNFDKKILFNNPSFNNWDPCISDAYYDDIPTSASLSYNPKTNLEIPINGSIDKSFGVDYIKIDFTDKGQVYINFNGDPGGTGNCPDFYLNLVTIDKPNVDNLISVTSGVGTAVIDITNATTAYLIIVRKDNLEATLSGPYGLRIGPTIPSGILKADFIKIGNKSSNSVCTNSTVQFSNLSHAGNSMINSYLWTFEGGLPSSSTSQTPPPILYSNPGVFSVSLTVGCVNGESDTKTINGYIIVYDPGSTTGDVLDISGSNPSFGMRNQNLCFNLDIYSGTPPFDITIDYGNGEFDHEPNYFSTSFFKFHAYQNEGAYNVTYTVTDALELTGTDILPISIGLPGSHTADFNYTWVANYPNTLGTNTEVTLHDATSGGYKPYSQWEWVYGKGINTGTPVYNTASSPRPWEIRANYPSDPLFNGSPLNTVIFTAYDIYPVTLTVTDEAGFQSSSTQYINVSTVPKCFVFNPEYYYPYNTKLKKHIVQFDNSSVTQFGTWNWIGAYFMGLTNYPNYCSGKYSINENTKTNVITNSRCTLKKDATTYPLYTNEMPQWYIDNPPPYPMPSYPGDINYYNWVWNGVDEFWQGWYTHYYNDLYDDINPVYPNDFEHTFQTAGVYKLLFEAWNKIAHPAGTNTTPENSGNLEMYNYLDMPIYVVDCGATEYVNQSVSAGTYDDRLAGIFEFANLNPVNIANSASISYQSCNHIQLDKGFSAEIGSNFKATITDLASDDIKINLDKQSNLTTKEEFKPISFRCYPNPNCGVFMISNSPNIKFENIEIFSISGQKCLSTFSLASSGILVTMQRPATGMYIVKLTTYQGDTYFEKISVLY